jgi:uncharacterized membrane protein YhhN
LILLFFLYTLVFTLLIITCYKDKFKKYYTLVKFTNSLLFIAIATCGVISSGDTVLYFDILPALVMCLIGDVILAISKGATNKNLFLLGLGSFLIGHILFILLFNNLHPLSIYDFILPIFSVLITFGLSKIKGMNVGNMLPCILLYSFFVSLLFFKSLGLLQATASLRNILLCVGSCLFFISDGIILFLYFYIKKHPLVNFFNLLTYYYGMFLIALSIFY